MLSVFKRTFVGLLAMALAGGMAVSCGGLIYEDEGDCAVSYRVRFRYDMNMKFADAFAHEVHSVTLYVLNEDGCIVWSKTESGDALAAEGYSMEVDVPAGKYGLLAWCDADEYKSWTFPQAKVRNDLGCALNHKSDADGSVYTDGRIDDLYYGYLAEADFSADEGTVMVTLPLMKNTNYFKVVLQHLSGKPVDKDKFEFFITDDNGKMDWDNSLLPCDSVTYRAWSVSSGSAEVDTRSVTEPAEATEPAEVTVPVVRQSSPATSVAELVEATEPVVRQSSPATSVASAGSATEPFGVALAELTTGRLFMGHKPRLHIRNKETGTTVLSVPLIDYALLVKGHYNKAIPDQEYLDRQDDYNMVFFLDKNENWANSFIYINSWKVVLQDTDL